MENKILIHSRTKLQTRNYLNTVYGVFRELDYRADLSFKIVLKGFHRQDIPQIA